MKKILKRICIFIALFLLAKVNYVHAVTDNCKNSNYQCIECVYNATGVNPNMYVNYEVFADGNGGARIYSSTSGKGSELIKWDLNLSSLDFINSNSLKCSNSVYMKHILNGNVETIYVSNNNDGDWKKSELTSNYDNDKSFLNSDSSNRTTYCKSIPIYLLGAGVKSGNVMDGLIDENYTKSSYNATVVKYADGNYDLELPSGYNKASGWKVADNSNINSCSNSLVVTCYEQNVASYQSSERVYTCSLNLMSKLDGRTEVDKDGKPINSDSAKSANVTPIEQNCKSMFGDPKEAGTPAYYLSIAFKYIKYIAIIILVVFSILDFVQAVTAQDNDALNKAVKKTITRLVLCVIIFILPILINLLLTIINDRAMSICINTNM